MKITILEYITGGGLRMETLSPSLLHEGELMLGALIEDLAELDGVRLTVLRDRRLPPLDTDPTRVRIIPVDRDADFQALWRDAIVAADAVWPIAPETGDILYQLCRDVENAGKLLLTSRSEAVRIATSKIATQRHLEKHGIAAVATYPLDHLPPLPAPPWVIKPDDGVGCEGNQIINDLPTLQALLDRSTDQKPVLQALIEGQAQSLSVLMKQGQAWLLSCNRMQVDRHDGGFRLTACEINAWRDDSGCYQRLAEAVAQALPGLWGYVGIDLMVSDQAIQVLEINPRLTTSYVGLKAALGINPARCVLALADSKIPLDELTIAATPRSITIPLVEDVTEGRA